jgi:hypothetical protein
MQRISLVQLREQYVPYRGMIGWTEQIIPDITGTYFYA